MASNSNTATAKGDIEAGEIPTTAPSDPSTPLKPARRSRLKPSAKRKKKSKESEDVVGTQQVKDGSPSPPLTHRRARLRRLQSDDDDDDYSSGDDESLCEYPGAFAVGGKKTASENNHDTIRIGDHTPVIETAASNHNLVVAELAPDESNMKERLAEQIRAEIEEANKNNSVVVAIATKEEDTEQQQQQSRVGRITILFAVLIGLVVFIVVMLTRPKPTEPSPLPTPSPSVSSIPSSAPSTSPSAAPTTAPSMAPTSSMEKGLTVLSRYVPGLSSNTTLSETQEDALAWLIENDDGLVAAEDSEKIVERYSLAILFYETYGKFWKSKGNNDWLFNQSVCDWQHLTCGDGVDGMVEYIDLQDNFLLNTIPSEIGYLSALTNLELGDNRLGGSVPTQIGQLTALTRLDLGQNILSGAIPSDLAMLTALTELQLSNNNLTGSVPLELASLLQSLAICDLEGNPELSGIPSNCGHPHGGASEDSPSSCSIDVAATCEIYEFGSFSCDGFFAPYATEPFYVDIQIPYVITSSEPIRLLSFISTTNQFGVIDRTQDGVLGQILYPGEIFQVEPIIASLDFSTRTRYTFNTTILAETLDSSGSCEGQDFYEFTFGDDAWAPYPEP